MCKPINFLLPRLLTNDWLVILPVLLWILNFKNNYKKNKTKQKNLKQTKK